MIFRLGLRDVQTQANQIIEVTAEPESSVASLLAALPIPVRGRPCFVGPVLLDPNASIGESGIVRGATISIGGPGPTFRASDTAVGRLVVEEGPDAGLSAWLPMGSFTLGRHPDATLTLNDSRVGRYHAQVQVSPDGIATITDLSSKNGTFVNGQRLASPATLRHSDRVEVGRDTLSWQSAAEAQRTMRAVDGHLDFDRVFAPSPAIARTEVELPNDERTPTNVVQIIIAGAVPLVMGVVMAILWSPTALMFALFGPVSSGVSYFVDRRRNKAKKKKFEEGKVAATERIEATVTAESDLRARLAPDAATVQGMAVGRSRGLWPRNADSPDGLVLRVGTADTGASIDLRGTPWPEFTKPVIKDAPVTVDLRTTGVLGVVGSGETTDALVRYLIAQLTTLRGPADLRLVVVTAADDDRLAWTMWLPHLDPGETGSVPCWIGNTHQTRRDRLAELKTIVATRMEQRGSGYQDVRFGEDIVVVLDRALELRNMPGLKEVLQDGPSVGVYSICVDRHGMNECRGLCEVESETQVRVSRTRADMPMVARPEGIPVATALSLARAVAPMRDRLTLAAGEAAIPYPQRFLDLREFGGRTLQADDVLGLWATQRGPTTRIPLGADAAGTFFIDVAAQGPHTMLAGATGTGKSILLQTLVTSLLLCNRPDELNLVLIDFKGGSAFLPFAALPHVVSLIRNTGDTLADIFDEAAAERVLDSVRTEVARREVILAKFDGELDKYWRAGCPGGALPRLVLIFDEFARVLEVSKDFLKELVNVAAKGRSLGMHLLLATQDLSGKLSDELKNNIGLRITLRQNDKTASDAVLGLPDAAAIPGRFFGRAIMLFTKDESRTPRTFQTGYLGNPPPDGSAEPAQVRMLDWATIGDPRMEEAAAPRAGASDQVLTIQALADASQRLRLDPPFAPLKPPLQARVELSSLLHEATLPPTAVPFGLIDQPKLQAQPVAYLDLAGTDRLLVAGGPQSGRTTFAHTFITALLQRMSPADAHLYVIEHQPSGLDQYATSPHCGGVFDPSEPDRVRRFVTWLDTEVQRRKALRFSSPGAPEPKVVLLIDGWEYFENRGPNFVETSLLQMLRGVINDGPPVGVHVVLVGGQEMMNGRTQGSYSTRILLRFPKEEDRKTHLRTGATIPPAVPGRAIDATTGLHLQIAVDTGSTLTTPPGAVGRGPKRFPPMPVKVSLAELNRDGDPGRNWIPIGRGGTDVSTIAVDLFDHSQLMMVSGPSESGRTNAATVVALGALAAGLRVLVVAPPRSPLQSRLPASSKINVLTGTVFKDVELRAGVEALGDGPYVVVFDDCEQISVTAEDGYPTPPTLLEEIAQPGSLGRRALVLCGDATPILAGQRRSLQRLLSDYLSEFTRVLLTPTGRHVVLDHGIAALEPDQYFAGPPGRGYLASGRTVSLIQLATP